MTLTNNIVNDFFCAMDVRMFDENDDITFICNDTHLENTNMEEILKELSPKSNVVSLPNHKKGPIYTVMPF